MLQKHGLRIQDTPEKVSLVSLLSFEVGLKQVLSVAWRSEESTRSEATQVATQLFACLCVYFYYLFFIFRLEKPPQYSRTILLLYYHIRKVLLYHNCLLLPSISYCFTGLTGFNTAGLNIANSTFNSYNVFWEPTPSSCHQHTILSYITFGLLYIS